MMNKIQQTMKATLIQLIRIKNPFQIQMSITSNAERKENT